jgi:pectin methylesterase-like acyl-CoA thioesterase/pectate lyase
VLRFARGASHTQAAARWPRHQADILLALQHFVGLIWLAAMLAVTGSVSGAAISVTSLEPTNGSRSVCADTLLRIRFDDSASLGTNGVIRIYQSGGVLVDTIDLARNATNGSQPRTFGGDLCNAYPVRVVGHTATVYPNPGKLPYNRTYYVTVDPHVFPGFTGISNANAWRFKTKASGPAAGSDYLVVAPDGSGDFCTVQGAVDFVPANNTNRVYINLRNGTYTEIVRVKAKHNLMFRGQNRKRTVLSYPNNDRINPGTATRARVNLQANDVVFEHLSLSNSTPSGGSQAEALRINGARCVVNECDIHSHQDTLLVNSPGNTAYVRNSLVEGDTDFVWGGGTVVFEGCEVKALGGGYLCQMRTPAGQHGAVFLDCRLSAAPGVSGYWLARIDPDVYPNSAVAFVNCSMAPHIAAAGWKLSGIGPTNALRFSEYQSIGTNGAAIEVSARAAFSHQLGESQAAQLRNLSHVLGGWLPRLPAPAFPGAEGAGARALGGRDGDVYYVTTLADSGPGSLRHGVDTAPASGRTILFKVSGTIELDSALQLRKRRITIAGQTAPGDGICLKNHPLRIHGDDVVVRHIKSRLGTDRMQEDDAVTIWEGVNVIVDHCSASWSVDEVLSATGDTDNLTVQWCCITEALDRSIHSKGPHGFGSLIAPYGPACFSFHHNLYAHNRSRNPRPGGRNGATLLFDFRNNVIYDWGYFAGYSAGTNEATDMNYVGNYLVKGPGSTKNFAFDGGGLTTRIFQSGNKIDLNLNGVLDGTDLGWGMFTGDYVAQPDAFVAGGPSTDSADVALQRVLSQAGSRPWNRDAADLRVTRDVPGGTGGFVDTPAGAGGYPILDSTIAPVDADGDGMPDFWESALGLDLAVADGDADPDGDGYTNLEDYLNWLAAPHGVTTFNTPVVLDLNTLNGGRTNLAYTLSGVTNGTVSLLVDGHTARFVPADKFTGRAAFDFSFTHSGTMVSQTVGLCVSGALPRN